jgi:hypothetical protein
VEKGKKKKNRSPLHAEAEGHIERLRELREKPSGARGEHIPHDVNGAENVDKRDFSTDERRRLARDHKALADGSYPIENEEDLHNAAVLARSGHGNVEAARRLIARRAEELGVSNPLDEKKGRVGPNDMRPAHGEHPDSTSGAVPNKSVGNPYVSPLVAHLRSRGLAVGHPDLQQSSTDFGPTVQAGTDNPTFIGGAGFHSAFSGTDMPAGADRGMPRVQLYDAAANAGHNGMLDQVRHDVGQEHATGRYDTARGSAAPDNGSHSHDSQAGACSVPRQSMKASSFDIIKQAMRDQGII